MDPQTLNLVSNAVTGVLGLLAIALSIVFYIAGRNTEKQIACAMSEIKTQTESLQKLSGKQIDKINETCS